MAIRQLTDTWNSGLTLQKQNRFEFMFNSFHNLFQIMVINTADIFNTLLMYSESVRISNRYVLRMRIHVLFPYVSDIADCFSRQNIKHLSTGLLEKYFIYLFHFYLNKTYYINKSRLSIVILFFILNLVTELSQYSNKGR